MFTKNMYVRYGSNGVFQIKDIITKKIEKKRKQYYVMEAVFGVDTRITTPVENPNIREILSDEAIQNLMNCIPTIEIKWLEDKRLRKEMYQKMVASNDPIQLAQVIKSLYGKQKEKEADKKALADDDLMMLELAEEILLEEIALTKHMDKGNVAEYILKNVQS